MNVRPGHLLLWALLGLAAWALLAALVAGWIISPWVSILAGVLIAWACGWAREGRKHE